MAKPALFAYYICRRRYKTSRLLRNPYERVIAKTREFVYNEYNKIMYKEKCF